MQLSLVRKWGERANYFIVAGDDDQTIYSFTGATPRRFSTPISRRSQDRPQAVVPGAAPRCTGLRKR